MAWKKSPPTEEGYYWVKAAGDLTGTIRKHIVHVYCSDPSSNKVTTVFWDGENLNIKSHNFKEWWDTPINIPPDK